MAKKAKKKSKKKTVKRTAKQRAATAKLVAMNKAKARQKRGERGLSIWDNFGKKKKGAKKKVKKVTIGDVCFRSHEGKLYEVGKVTATCPPGFFHTRK